MKMIPICRKCDSKYIKIHKKENKNIFICIECGTKSSETTKKERCLNDNDYKIYDNDTSLDDRLILYNFLFENIKSKNKFLNGKDVNSNLRRWLDINYIIIKDIDITVENVFNYSKNIKECDMVCKNPNCNNITPFFKIWDRNPNGRRIYCSEKCLFEERSIRQMGKNNTSFKISDENKKIMSINQSKLMKEKIKNGDFTPNITNSWCYSMCEININNEIKKYRSTWEAFFNLVNPTFIYEKIRIPYTYNKTQHNYIVDFVDNDNKILYEIKPLSERYKSKNEEKTKAAISWGEKNGYHYNIIDNSWFNENYPKYKYLIKNQIDEYKLNKNLKQFDNEN